MAATDKNLELPEQPDDWSEQSDQQTEQELAIGNRLGNWKTIASFAFAIAVFAFAFVKGGFDPHAIWNRVKHLNLAVFLLAFLVYYATFPIRGYRWKVLLQNAYRGHPDKGVDDMTIRGLSEIIYISWFVNCVVPAKLGDLYRAYLAKLWVHISWTKTIGTVLAERIIDILVLGLLLAGTGFVVFHNRLGGVGKILLFGMALSIVGILLLVAMKTFSAHIQRLVPHRFREKYVSFEEGAFRSFHRIPLLVGLTVVIWLLEGSRFQLVFTALGLSTSHISAIPFAPVLFFALGTAVLTTIPFTPGGLGLVEAGLVGMMIYLGVPKVDAAAVVLVDRILSYYSVAFFGFVVYLLSKRSHFRHPV
ncbi:MAG TPA: lysylphosphatidylglycerol synthase transmembrane domain-containing protein [Chloroflexota bacterium]